ncbi:MAG: hypothetical protein M1826_006526 [Phylliscum demangeonii]|nr:MAG: hypothetical protein M1826_006526 [Phylliscum demangeonii]
MTHDDGSVRAQARSAIEPRTKRKKARSSPGANSLRRVAVEAEQSREGLRASQHPPPTRLPPTKHVRAYCIAERFNLAQAVAILKARGLPIDPVGTGLYPQVIHTQLTSGTASTRSRPGPDAGPGSEPADVFIFPSGTAVVWSVEHHLASELITDGLVPAAENAHLDQIETEDLDYVEDGGREHSSIKGDTIILGTKTHAPDVGDAGPGARHVEPAASASVPRSQVDTVLAKIAFSSGLARSTKLAVLETLLDSYFESTRSIPTMLSQSKRLPFTRSFILRKTGQLLSVRAQLNLYSELTDSLPDIFWDSRHDLGLEAYYDQAGRALDVAVRIKVLNAKMDYAQEIASVLRERLSERHGLVLEWMIIALIAVEVGFEVLRLLNE